MKNLVCVFPMLVARTAEIVNGAIPKVLWEYGVDDPGDPSWVRTDISWSTDPDDWETARAELAGIIENFYAGLSHQIYLSVVIKEGFTSRNSSLAN